MRSAGSPAKSKWATNLAPSLATAEAFSVTFETPSASRERYNRGVFNDAHDMIEQFDRRYQTVASAEGRQYVVELRAWLNWLRVDSRLEFARGALKTEWEGFVGDYRALAVATADRLEPVRKQILEVFPDAADTEWDRLSGAYADLTFERFDRRVERVRKGEVLVPADWREDSTRGSSLIEALESKLSQASMCVRNPAEKGSWNALPEGQRKAGAEKAEPVRELLSAAKKTHVYELHELSLRLAASGSFALSQLEELLGHGLNPAPGSLPRAVIAKTPKGESVGAFTYEQAVFALKSTAEHEQTIAKLVSALKPLADRPVVAVRQLLSARAGLVSLAHRFQIRCQHYDLKALRDLVLSSKSKVELALTAHFARYLYDAGHVPLFSEVSLGNSRADLLALGNVYVESKQVDSSDKPYILRGYWQLRDGIHQLPPRHGVRTALLVVFVLAGPLYEIDEVPSAGLLTLPLVIDLREANQKGSKAAQAVVRITREEFKPELADAPPELKAEDRAEPADVLPQAQPSPAAAESGAPPIRPENNPES
jgi:hypothetical protein